MVALAVTHLDPQSKELVSRLYSSNEYNKREAIYRILFDRRHDLLPELKKAVKYERNEQIAVFMVQVGITLSTFPRDNAMERRILEILQYEEGGGVNDLAPTMWKYLENNATSQMMIAILGCMGNSIPSNGYEFIETCLTHPDPDVRAMVCEKAIKSGRPTHFAYVLNLVADKDPIVSATAFCAIKDMPKAELAIMLDYALGSPDEWVLNTVAPFLPNLITDDLRSVVAKVQYHPNQLVAHKAREALKNLDAIPYITKRSQKDRDEAAKRKEEEKEEAEDKKEVVLEDGRKVSLKEQLEIKRREKEEEERKKREADEALDRELAAIKGEELDSFAREMENYDSVLPVEEKPETIEEIKDELPEEKEFIENQNFMVQADLLASIEESDLENVKLDLESEPEGKVQNFEDPLANLDNVNEDIQPKVEALPEIPRTPAEFSPETIPLATDVLSETEMSSATEISSEVESSSTTEVTIDLEESLEADLSLDVDSQIAAEMATETVSSSPDIALPSDEQSKAEAQPTIDSVLEEAAQAVKEIPLENEVQSVISPESASEEKKKSSNTDIDNISVEDLDNILNGTDDFLNSVSEEDLDLNIADEAEIPAPKPEKPKPKFQRDLITQLETHTATDKTIEDKATKPEDNKTSKPIESNSGTPALSKPTKVAVPMAAKDIFARYPSFITDPLLEVYSTSDNKLKLKAIEKVLNNLTAFLNICFLQSSIFYAKQSDMLTKSIKECLKANLLGTSALRFLHNFVLAMKTAMGTPVFFTFPLAKVLSDSSESNPLMMMRELNDFLREPEEPLDESVPMAVDGLLEILRGVRAITLNTLVMRAPIGAKLPYADLSGPSAVGLVKEKMPEIDLPVGEIVLISKDGSDALGLFPFFKYAKKKIVYVQPTKEEFATLCERLELTGI